MARFNEGAVKKPELEPLPPLPAENGEAAAPAASETPKTAETPKESAATPEAKADDAKAPIEEEEEEEETNEAAPPASSLQQAGDASDAKPTTEAPQSETAKPEDTNQTATESKSDAAKPAETKAAPKHSAEYERVLAERKRIETENKRKLDEYNALVAKGQQEVKDLNLRFGDWYFVVSNDTFKKVRLGKDDVVKKKEAKSEPAASNTNSSAAGAPGTAVPGLPAIPGVAK